MGLPPQLKHYDEVIALCVNTSDNNFIFGDQLAVSYGYNNAAPQLLGYAHQQTRPLDWIGTILHYPITNKKSIHFLSHISKKNGYMPHLLGEVHQDEVIWGIYQCQYTQQV
jgi:hypothetical protein